MTNKSSLPSELAKRDSIVIDDDGARLSFFLPPDVAGDLEMEAQIREIALTEIVRAAGKFACLGQQIDGYRVVAQNKKVLDAFLAHDAQTSLIERMQEAAGQEETVAIHCFSNCLAPAAVGTRLRELMGLNDLLLSELMVAGLLDRREVRRRQAPGVRLEAIKGGEYQVTVVSLT